MFCTLCTCTYLESKKHTMRKRSIRMQLSFVFFFYPKIAIRSFQVVYRTENDFRPLRRRRAFATCEAHSMHFDLLHEFFFQIPSIDITMTCAIEIMIYEIYHESENAKRPFFVVIFFRSRWRGVVVFRYPSVFSCTQSADHREIC